LLCEYLALSWLVDLPIAGPAVEVAALARLAIPVVLGAATGAWLLSRHRPGSVLDALASTLPPWRPLPGLALHLAGFAATCLLAWSLLQPGAPTPGAGPLAGVLALGLLTLLLALTTAAPLAWFARTVIRRWQLPVLALTLGLLAWRAAAAAEGLWGVLTAFTLHAVGWLLGLVASGVVVIPAEKVIGLRGFEVEVAPVCSGVDGLGLVILFQAVWLSLSRSRLRLPRALIVLPIGAVAALAANVLRMAALVLVGASGREELAMGGLHSKLGWLLFTAIALASVAAAERVAWLRLPEADATAEVGLPPRAAAYLAPLLAAIGAALVAGIWSQGPLDRWYVARPLAAALALLLVRRELPRPALAPTWFPVAVGLAVAAAWIAVPGGDIGPLGTLVGELPSGTRAAWIAARLAGSILLIPAVEELAFRGFLLPWLSARDFETASPSTWSWPALLLSSLAFGTLHGHWVLGSLAGVAFAAARIRSGRLGDAILAHAVANAGIAAAVLAGGRWDLWAP